MSKINHFEAEDKIFSPEENLSPRYFIDNILRAIELKFSLSGDERVPTWHDINSQYYRQNPIATHLKDHSYITFPQFMKQKDFDLLADLFRREIVHPVRTSQHLDENSYFSLIAGEKKTKDKKKDIGYFATERNKGDTDDKYYFHYNLYLEEKIQDHWDNLPDHFKQFIIQLRKIYEQALIHSIDMVIAMERDFPSLRDCFFQPGKKPFNNLRIINYLPAVEEGNFIAKAHYDKGSFTLALGESEPGLQIGSDQSTLKNVVHHEGQALFFLGKNFPEVIRKFYCDPTKFSEQEILAFEKKLQDIYLPGYHQVVQSTQNERYAVVFFTDNLSDFFEITYEQAHPKS